MTTKFPQNTWKVYSYSDSTLFTDIIGGHIHSAV